MAVNRITITQQDKYQTIVYPYYTDAEEVLGSVLVLHGMAEHHDRYKGFAEFLNKNGFDVFLYDHRGHGTDKKIDELGFFAEKDGYKLVVEDAIKVLKYVKESNRGPKTVLFGHSMGSIISRNVIQAFDDIDAAVISGTGSPRLIKSAFGIMVSAIIRSIKGPKTLSPFLNEATVGGKSFQRLCERTAVDWLTRDNNIIGQYLSDPYCGFVCTTSFYNDLIHLTYRAAKPSRIKKTRRDLPIYFTAGACDPVGGYGEDVARLFGMYQRYEFTHTDCTIYEDCRHELLNELNKDKIMADIAAWIKKAIE